MNGAQSLVATLVDQGVDICFANPGTSETHFLAALENPRMVKTDARGWDHIGNPIRFANEPGREQFELPESGQHSQEILRAVGYSDDEIAKLGRQGTIK